MVRIQMWVDPEFKELTKKMKVNGCSSDTEATRNIARVFKSLRIFIKKK